MKKQKLDVEQTIETLRKSVCEEAILSAQRIDGREHVTKQHRLPKPLRKRNFCTTNFVGMKKSHNLNTKLY